MSPERLNWNAHRLGWVKKHATEAKRRDGVFIHHAAGTLGGNVEDIIQQLKLHGYGYNYLIKGDTVYVLAQPFEVVSHAAGWNRSHVGIALAYLGPSVRPRGMPGEAGPGPTGLHHPPIDPVAVQTARKLVAWLRRQGVGDDLRVHWLENPLKADPWPLTPPDFEPGPEQ